MPIYPLTPLGSSLGQWSREHVRASNETAERLQRAAADAQAALAAEVDRVSAQLKSEHEKALDTAVREERDTARARQASALKRADALWMEKQEEQVGAGVRSPRLYRTHAS